MGRSERAALRVRDGALTLTTMRFHDEVRPAGPIPTGKKPTRKRRRRKIEVPEPEKQPSPAPDLMEALERTLAKARAGRDIRDVALAGRD